MEEGGFPGGVRGDELLPEGEAVGEVVRRVGHDVQVYAAVRLGQAGLGGEDLVGGGLALPEEHHAKARHGAGTEEEKDEQQMEFLFHNASRLSQNLK